MEENHGEKMKLVNKNKWQVCFDNATILQNGLEDHL